MGGMQAMPMSSNAASPQQGGMDMQMMQQMMQMMQQTPQQQQQQPQPLQQQFGGDQQMQQPLQQMQQPLHQMRQPQGGVQQMMQPQEPQLGAATIGGANDMMVMLQSQQAQSNQAQGAGEPQLL